MALNALNQKVTGVVTPTSGRTPLKLYKDPSFTQYDVFAFDALDDQSFPKQAAPSAADTLFDISPADGADASFSAVAPGFDGGFTFTSGQNQTINLPAQCKPAATSRGNIAMTWIAYVPVNAIRKLFGWMRSGPVAASWGVYTNNAGGGLQLAVFADGASATITLPSAGLYLFALGRVEDGAGGYLARRRIIRQDGTIVTSSGAASGATAAQPSASVNIGADSTFGTAADMRIFRQRMVDVGTVAGVATAAWFDAIVDAEFAANKARADWKLS